MPHLLSLILQSSRPPPLSFLKWYSLPSLEFTPFHSSKFFLKSLPSSLLHMQLSPPPPSDPSPIPCPDFSMLASSRSSFLPESPFLNFLLQNHLSFLCSPPFSINISPFFLSETPPPLIWIIFFLSFKSSPFPRLLSPVPRTPILYFH